TDRFIFVVGGPEPLAPDEYNSLLDLLEAGRVPGLAGSLGWRGQPVVLLTPDGAAIDAGAVASVMRTPVYWSGRKGWDTSYAWGYVTPLDGPWIPFGTHGPIAPLVADDDAALEPGVPASLDTWQPSEQPLANDSM